LDLLYYTFYHTMLHGAQLWHGKLSVCLSVRLSVTVLVQVLVRDDEGC